MLQQRGVTGTAGDCSTINDGHPFVTFPTSHPTPKDASEEEWKPFDLIRKRSGPHNLTRSGYDEDSMCCILFCLS